MKNTCCYKSSMEKLAELWEEKYKVYLEYNYEYIRYYLIEILSKHRIIQRMAKKVYQSEKNHVCRNVSKKIMETKFTSEDLQKLKKTIGKLKRFDMNQKRNFLCFLCDFESLKNIHLQDKLVVLNYEVCEELVQQTYEEYYFLNEFVYKYLNTANFLSYCVNNESVQDFGLLEGREKNEYEFL